MRLNPLSSWRAVERYWDPPPTVAVVPMVGVIGRPGGLTRALSLRSVAPLLERAFKLRGVKAVALSINSPGGSAVQASLIAQRIRALREEHGVPVVAFAEDVAASGGYWLMTAADEAYADASSIVGSIGVISAGFGFPEALKRLGIERRVYTAGTFKGALDPFRPENDDDVAHLKRIQAEVHEAFRAQVRARRGSRLKAAEEEAFSGRFWSGAEAVELGLIDGLAEVRGFMRKRYGKRVRLRLIAEPRRWWQRRLGRVGGDLAGSPQPALSAASYALAAAAIAALEDRAVWQRYGV
jgi:signal peptide peptidase SppA